MASDRPSSDIVLSVKPNAQHRDERGEHRHRQRQAGDDRRAPRVQEQEHHEHGEHGALDQRRLDVAPPSCATRTPASRTTRSVDAGGQRAAGSRRPASRIVVGDGGRAVALRLLDVDADGVLAVVERRRARLLGAVRDRRRRRRAGRRGRCARRRRAARSPRRLEAAAQADRALVERRRSGGRPARRGSAPAAPARPAPTLMPAACSVARPQLDGQLALDAADDVDLARRRGCPRSCARDAGIGEPRQLRGRQRRRRRASARRSAGRSDRTA